MDPSHIKFAKRSLQKTRKFKDHFIKFIVLWIGLNALYYNPKIRREEDRIKSYLKNNKDLIFNFLYENQQNLESVADFIKNTPQHIKLSEFLKTRRAFLILKDKENSINDFAEFLYYVRNHMFHAAKMWNEKDEATLLSMINPILGQLIEKLLREPTNFRQSP